MLVEGHTRSENRRIGGGAFNTVRHVVQHAPLRVVARVAAALAIFTSVTTAQSRPQGPRVSVVGLAYDSLHNVPLANAFVMIAELSRSTQSDDKGRFVFDSVPAGTYNFAMQHAVFDSLGLSGAQSRVVVTDGKGAVTLAVPSFASLWTAACGAIPVPANDSGLVYGTIQNAKTKSPLPEAWIELSWFDLVNLGTKEESSITQRRWKSETQSDANGGYAVCGVPLSTQLRIRASYLANATGTIDIPSSPDRVRRRNLTVSGTITADSSGRGAVLGVVTNQDGRGVADVRVILDDAREARTDRDGRFLISNVPTGTRQMDMAAIGMTPVSQTVDVFNRDTAFVSASLRTVSNLEAINVLANATVRRKARLLEERRKQGFGSFADSTTIGKRGTLSASFSMMPGVTVENVRSNGRLFNLYLPSTGMGPCLAMLMVDGIQQFDHEILGALAPSEIAAIEVYQHRLTVPTDLMRTDAKCGLIAVWTKRALR